MAPFPKIALNVLLVLAFLSVAVVRSSRGAYWGPEGPVGGWLLLIPPLFLMGGIVGTMVMMGQFDWVPGGRGASVVLLLGFMIGSGAGLWFTFERPQNAWQAAAGIAPW